MRGHWWLTLASAGLLLAAPAWTLPAQAEEAGDIRLLPNARRQHRPAPARPASSPMAPPPLAQESQVRPPPPIDRPALQPVGPGEQPAPVPYANAQPPLVDRQPRPSFAFGVPTPPLFGQGETFARPDSVNETARAQQGVRLPSPGATFRLPVW
jgi:hypothetical protein